MIHDKQNFDSYKTSEGKLENLEKVITAYKYNELYKIVEDPQGRGNELKSNEKHLSKQIENQTAKIDDVKSQINLLEKKNVAYGDEGLLNQIRDKELEHFKMEQDIKNDTQARDEYLSFKSANELKVSSL